MVSSVVPQSGLIADCAVVWAKPVRKPKSQRNSLNLIIRRFLSEKSMRIQKGVIQWQINFLVEISNSTKIDADSGFEQINTKRPY
jgi:hypothetical protein